MCEMKKKYLKSCCNGTSNVVAQWDHTSYSTCHLYSSMFRLFKGNSSFCPFIRLRTPLLLYAPWRKVRYNSHLLQLEWCIQFLLVSSLLSFRRQFAAGDLHCSHFRRHIMTYGGTTCTWHVGFFAESYQDSSGDAFLSLLEAVRVHIPWYILWLC